MLHSLPQNLCNLHQIRLVLKTHCYLIYLIVNKAVKVNANEVLGQTEDYNVQRNGLLTLT